jgi:hypothetical protein
LSVRWAPADPLTHKIDFYSLPRPVQERFAAATRGAAPPAPILFERAPRTGAWAYLGASGALLGAVFVALRCGWGDVHSALALHGAKMLALDSVLLGAASFCVLRGVGSLLTLDSTPYRPGIYLFPGCVVDAKAPLFEVWAMGDVESIERLGPPAPGLAFRMRDGSRIVVPAESAGDAERAHAVLEPLRSELARAEADGDPRALVEFDPLHDRALSSPIGPSEAMKQKVSPWIRFDWAIAAALGIALGQGIGTTRNAMSDAAMYRNVTEAASVSEYEAYLAQPAARADEVRDVLLPLAQLRDAERQGTVEAIAAFAETPAAGKIGPEVKAAMGAAMRAELGRAKREGTLAALDGFARRYPQSSLYADAELRSARHAFFVQAFLAWKHKAAPDAATEAFFERLFAEAEKSGPGVEVRFRRETSTSIADADRSVQKSARYPGSDALPSNYVTAEALQGREQRVAEGLVAAFAEAFPPDVLSLRPGAVVAADAPVEARVPTLVIEYAPEWSRANTACEKPSTVFAGLIFSFNATFVLPDGPPLKTSVKAWRGAAVWKAKTDRPTREEFEQKVYAAMIDGAFDQLEKKLEDTLIE